MFSTSMSDILAVEREARKIGATEALSRLREKVAQMESWDYGCAPRTAVDLNDVLALIDEEMRDA